MHIHWLETVGSTNDRALELANEGAADGAVVAARAQSEGRGRHGRSWYSPGGNVYLSIIHRPQGTPDKLAGLTLELAVGVAKVLEARGLTPRLKWPNDVYFGARKVGGILTEFHFLADGSPVVIAGLGMNVNTAPADFPEELAAIATSLRTVTGAELDCEVLVAELAAALSAACTDFAGRGGLLLSAYVDRCSSIGRRVRVSPGDAIGTATGVAEDGSLLVLFDDRSLPEPVRSGVVEHLD